MHHYTYVLMKQQYNNNNDIANSSTSHCGPVGGHTVHRIGDHIPTIDEHCATGFYSNCTESS